MSVRIQGDKKHLSKQVIADQLAAVMAVCDGSCHCHKQGLVQSIINAI